MLRMNASDIETGQALGHARAAELLQLTHDTGRAPLRFDCTTTKVATMRDRATEFFRRNGPGVVVIDKREDAGYATPLDVVGEFGVYVSRLRKDASVENALNMWIVADNLRKGAALNAVQIAELAVERGLV